MMNYAASFSSPSDQEDNSSSSSDDDNEVDETLVRELREALHFSIGKICRAEELAAAQEIENDGDDGSNNDGMMTTTTTKKTNTVMTKDAIVALTELVYHYTTSSLANDAVAFSNHANRRTVKAEDVLLVVRKDKQILAELKRKMKPAESTSSKRGNNSTAVGSGKTKKKTNATKNSNPLFNSGKKESTAKATAKATKTKSMRDMMFSSSSSSSSDSDEDTMKRIRQRPSELKQKNLNNTAFDCANKNDDSSSSSSSSSDGLEFTNIGTKSTTKNDNGKKKRSINQKRNDTEEDDMVIDLADSD